MCLAAIHWARIARVVYCATAQDAANAGFDDRWIADQLAAAPAEARLPRLQLASADALRPFKLWAANQARAPY